MQPSVPLVLLLAGLSSGQILVSLRSLGAPRPALLQMARKPESPFSAALDYKQQVEQRNQQCYQQCAEEFPTAEGSVKACERGCRLFALSEATKPKQEEKEHREKCNKDCEEAYPVLVEQHSCQSGCRHQQAKQQDGDGAPVVMSVVRQFSVDSSGGQEVRRSQSSVLVRDGDGVRVIQGPTKLTVSRHGEDSPLAGGPDPSRVVARPGLLSFTDGADEPGGPGLDGMMSRMREAMRRMMAHLTGEPEPELEPESEPRHLKLNSSPRVIEVEAVRPAAVSSGWHRVWRCSPHYVVLAALLLGTALVLYGVYCLACVVLRARRRQPLLIQNEELAQAEDLPPKYCVVEEKADPEVKTGAPSDVPPAYTAVATESEIPPKPDL